MKRKQLVRQRFRDAVFYRDNYKCIKCGDKAVDAHHITDRSLMPNGGYVKENGASLCSDCHKKAEEFHITQGRGYVHGYKPEDLYELIKSSYELAVEKSK